MNGWFLVLQRVFSREKNHLAEFLKCQHLGRTANTKFRMESND